MARAPGDGLALRASAPAWRIRFLRSRSISAKQIRLCERTFPAAQQLQQTILGFADHFSACLPAGPKWRLGSSVLLHIC
jgi:hypothetical protein